MLPHQDVRRGSFPGGVEFDVPEVDHLSQKRGVFAVKGERGHDITTPENIDNASERAGKPTRTFTLGATYKNLYVVVSWQRFLFCKGDD